MIGIIVASHGPMAAGVVETSQWFFGEQPQLEALCLQPGQDLEEFDQQIREAAERVDTGDGVLVLCDLLFGTPCNRAALQISEKILPPMSKMVVSEHLPHAWLEAEAYTRLQQTLIQVMQCYLRRKENYSLYCVGQSCLILHLLLSKMPVKELSAEEQISIDKRNARLKRLLGFVDENYMHKIRLTDFARQEGCSLSYLSRFIKEVLNQSFQEYVTSVRFNCACKLIASGQKRMLDVCMESGFSDYRYFSREFQRQYGMTPEQYRNLSQKEQLSAPAIRHSLHSVERFYSEEESLEIMQRLVG